MKSLGVKIILGISLLAVGVFAALWLTSVFSGPNSETRNTQLVKSITREEQVVLLSLGIEGISEKNDPQTKLFGLFDIPGSERATFVKYSFDAKLGIEGKNVVIKQIGEDEFLVSVPEFIFVGYNNPDLEFIVEKNGVLSFVTPKADAYKASADILSLDDLDVQKKYIDKYQETLRDQAEVFYSRIITSIDPTIVVRFEFR